MLKALITIVITISLVIGAIMLSNNFAYMEHGDAKFVYDTTSVNDSMVAKIHQFLLAENAYQNNSGELFLLKQTDTGMWMIKFPVYQGGDVAPDKLKEVERLAKALQANILNGQPVEVHITNASYQGVQFFKI